MLRFFRRRQRHSLEPDAENVSRAVTSEDRAESGLGPSPSRRPLKWILALGICALGFGSLYLSWSGGRRNDPTPPRLLPQASVPLAQESPEPPQTPGANAEAPQPSADRAARVGAGATQPADQRTFSEPLSRDPRETAPIASGDEGAPYYALAQASHEATMENLRLQIAELKLKRLKAELEADGLRKNPRGFFREEKASAKLKKEPNPVSHLARVPSPATPISGSIPEHQAQVAAGQLAASSVPPQMRVRMVTLEPKEAVIEAGDGDSRGWFTVREGQKFPDFVVNEIGRDGVTISFGSRAFFYPVGSSALGAGQDNRQSGSGGP